jgi:hypothetical protein
MRCSRFLSASASPHFALARDASVLDCNFSAKELLLRSPRGMQLVIRSFSL